MRARCSHHRAPIRLSEHQDRPDAHQPVASPRLGGEAGAAVAGCAGGCREHGRRCLSELPSGSSHGWRRRRRLEEDSLLS